MAMFWPSTHPRSRRPCLNASTLGEEIGPLSKAPTRWTLPAGCAGGQRRLKGMRPPPSRASWWSRPPPVSSGSLTVSSSSPPDHSLTIRAGTRRVPACEPAYGCWTSVPGPICANATGSARARIVETPYAGNARGTGRRAEHAVGRPRGGVLSSALWRLLRRLGKRVDELRRLITRHDHTTTPSTAPEVTDAEYDALVRELRKLEAGHPGSSPPTRRRSGSAARCRTPSPRWRTWRRCCRSRTRPARPTCGSSRPGSSGHCPA